MRIARTGFALILLVVGCSGEDFAVQDLSVQPNDLSIADAAAVDDDAAAWGDHLLWSRQLQAAPSLWAASVACDGDRNIIVAGTLVDETLFSGWSDVWIGKYDRDGRELWSRAYDGEGHFNDLAEDVGADPVGNVFVLGRTHRSSDLGNGEQMWLTKLDADGNSLWSRTAESVWPVRLAVDGGGNVVVIGTLGQPFGGQPWLRKFDPDGNEIWTRTWNHPSGYPMQAIDLAVDDQGNLLAAANFRQSRPPIAVSWLREYDPAGQERWTSIERIVHAVAFDEEQHPFALRVTGGTVLTRFGDDGSLQTEIPVFYYPAERVFWPLAFALAPNGRFVIGGQQTLQQDPTTGIIQLSAIHIRDYRFDTGGARWTQVVQGPGPHAGPRRITVDKAGDLVAVGTMNATTGPQDFIWLGKLRP